MGKRGPVPLPSNVTRLRGTFRPDRTKDEPKPKPLAPGCPRWLDQMGRAEWRRVAPALERLGLLTEIDGTALACYCDAYSRWRKAREVIVRQGMTKRLKSGYVQQRPEVAIARQSMLLVRAFCQEFGLTPSSRGRISIPQSEDDAEEDLD